MPEENDADVQPEDEGLPANIQAQLRIGRKAKRDLELAQAALATAERESAFTKAGLKDSPVRELFVDSYKGSLDVEAIRTAATKYDLVDAVQNSGNDDQLDAELDRQRLIQQAAGGNPSGDQDLAGAFATAANPAAVMELVEQGTKLGATDIDGRIIKAVGTY